MKAVVCQGIRGLAAKVPQTPKLAWMGRNKVVLTQ